MLLTIMSMALSLAHCSCNLAGHVGCSAPHIMAFNSMKMLLCEQCQIKLFLPSERP
jgi:hypothetical protein